MTVFIKKDVCHFSNLKFKIINLKTNKIMAFNLRNRNFLKLLDFTPKEIKYMLDLAADLKKAKYAGTEQPRLKGKNIALIFEKTSTRTRCAFEVAAYDQGAHVTYLGPSGSQIGVKESMADTARVLGRMFDGIEYRGFAQDIVEELAGCSYRCSERITTGCRIGGYLQGYCRRDRCYCYHHG